MNPDMTYIFTSLDGRKSVTIVADNAMHARRILNADYGESYRDYTVRRIPNAGNTNMVDEQLVTKVAQYLGRSMGASSTGRARRVIQIIRESEHPEPMPGDVSPLSEAAAFLGKTVIVTDRNGTPEGAGVVESVEKTYTRGMTLFIKNFGTANPVAYNYAKYTFTEIDKTN